MSNSTELSFIDEETRRLQLKKQNIDAAVTSQQRALELNDSYRKRYHKYIEILIVLIVTVGLYLGITTLQKQFSSIPSVAFDIAMLLVIVYVAFYLWYAAVELFTRDQTNYDELDLPPVYDASGTAASTDLINKGQLSGLLSQDVCIGQECCPTYWDSGNNHCIRNGFTTLDQAFDFKHLTLPPFSNTPAVAAMDATSLEYGSYNK